MKLKIRIPLPPGGPDVEEVVDIVRNDVGEPDLVVEMECDDLWDAREICERLEADLSGIIPGWQVGKPEVTE